jgi:hypothetical protein
MGKILDISNKIFGRLLVISFSHKNKHHKAQWLCRCSCGKEKIIDGQSLIRGLTTSCGCYHVEILKSEKSRQRMSEYNKSVGRFVGKNNPMYGLCGDKNPSNRPDVKKKISDSKLGDKNPSKRIEVRKKLSEKHKGRFIGEKNFNWKGGISSDRDKLRNTFEYHEWRRSVFKRDNYICQKCNISRSGKLQAHHVESFDNNKDIITEIENGITFCIDCHIDFHRKYGRGNNTKGQLEKYLKTNIGLI